MTTSTGTGQLQKGHGVAFGDIDNDGDEDVYANIGGAIPSDEYNKALYENPGHPGNWISLKLVGVKSNRSAIGSRVIVRYGGRQQAQEVMAQSSFYSANDRRLHFGLGAAQTADEVVVRWPDGTRTVRTNVRARQFLVVKKGA